MKPSLAVSLAAAACVSATCATADEPQRQLQFSPQGNSPGPFRPRNAPLWPPTNLAPDAATNNRWGLESAAAPTGNLAGTNAEAGDEADADADADAAVAPTTGAATTTTAAGTATATDLALPNAATFAPGQPTIMVILPDFLAAGSGWSSYKDDATVTTVPPSETPKEAESAAASPSRRLAMAAVAVSMAVALALATGV